MPEPPRTGEAVLELVRKSDVVDVAALTDYLSRSGPLPSPGAADTATDLVRAGLLTPFQAKLILQGKYKGFRIGPYRILDQIGTGGMGQVFLAEHTAMRRRVAVKVLPARLAVDPAGVERFYREARAVAALDHPNIVRAYDVGCDKGTHYLVLEYVEGKTVERRLKEAGGRLHWGEATGYAVQAAAGLKHAHDRGLVHRDVKPANLLIDREGVVKILDLGLARFFEDDRDRLTRNLDPNGVMGTADYVAPEQLLDSSATDYRADIYSLGATLYHLVTGQTPFQGSTTAKLVAHQLHTPAAAHTVGEVPEELSAVIGWMMAKKAEDRPTHMGEVVSALLPFVTPADGSAPGSSSVSLPPLALAAVSQTTANLTTSLTRANEPVEQPKSRTKLYALVGLAVAMVAGGAAIAVALSGAPGKEPVVGNTTDPPADPPTPPWTPPSQPTKQGGPPKVDGPAKLTLAYKLPAGDGKSGVEATVFTPDGKYLLTSGQDKLVRVWDATTGKPVRTLKGHEANVRALSLLPGGRRVLTASADKTVKLFDIETGEHVRTFFGSPSPISNVVALPNGRRFLTAAHDGSVWLWDVDRGEPVVKYAAAPLPVYGLAVTRDSRRAVAATWDDRRNSARPGDDLTKRPQTRVWLFDLATGKEIRSVPTAASVSHVTLSPNSRHAAFGTGDGVMVWDLDTGALRSFTGLPARVTCAAYTRDGRHIVSTGHDKSISLWDATTGRLIESVPVHPSAGYGVGFSPDGKRVATSGASGSAGVWQLPGAAVSRLPGAAAPVLAAVLAGHTAALEDVLFTPDGRAVTCATDKTVRVWDVETGEQLRQFAVPFPTARGLALLGANRLVVTFTADPTVRMYDLNIGKELWQFSGHTKGVISAAALPGGKRFLTSGHDGTVRLWDGDSGQEQARFDMKSPAHGLAVTPDGKQFLVGCADKTVRLWSLESRSEVRRITVAAIAWRVGVSADGTQAAFGSDAQIVLWTLANGDTYTVSGPTRFVDGTAFTRDRRFVLAGSMDRSLYVWDVTNGQISAKVTEHTNNVRGVAISPDGRYAVTTGTDGTAMSWRLPAAMLPK
jgi:serine/threonine-protein kinase